MPVIARLACVLLLAPALAVADGIPTPAPPAKTIAEAAARCAKNDAKACARAGELYQDAYFSGDNSKSNDGEKSRAAYHKACDLDDLDGCFGVAWWYDESRDYKTAVAMFEPLCRAHHVRSCAMLAMDLERGDGAPKDVPRAQKLYEQACSAAKDEACLAGCDMLGLAYRYGTAPLPRDHAKALALYDRGCEVGCMNSCDDAAKMHREGDGGAKDPVRSAAQYKTACDKGFPPSCESLSELYATGTGVAKSAAKAKQLHARACRLSDDQVSGCRPDN